MEPHNPFVAARFLLSVAALPQLPAPDRPEIAFAGRSNAGKSSALNTITNKKALARVSKTPGRTQLLNFFEQDNARLVDLPGYGYAKVPEPTRRQWGKLVGGYIETRESLVGVVIIMDIRHPLTDYDLQMLEWTQAYRRRVHVLLTKADKLAFGAAKNQLLAVQKALSELENVEASAQLFSSHKRTGCEEARKTLSGWIADASEGFASPEENATQPE
ncbi:MAG: ribosome biogenesis GTP-binding protein YihA/YsxC [Pseudomonadota bacterium]|nr:ribosome biogenesis GTP-binding protein YihA/YsxC [Pseudomonadota bacterium]